MTKEMIAIIACGVSLIAAVYGFGMRIGALTERVEAQTKQIELLTTDLRAINQHFIVWAGSHRDP